NKVQDSVSDIALPDFTPVNCSIGIYVGVKEYEEAFLKAEKALHKAKESLSEKCVIYVEDDKTN
ncbi:MAG: hypothetical protein GX488_07705, partial [Clostridiales bacterium]|nr:hypothetical protein [Clostridiales bacterium]